MDGRTGGRTFEIHLIRSTRRSQPKNVKYLIPVLCTGHFLVFSYMFTTSTNKFIQSVSEPVDLLIIHDSLHWHKSLSAE